MPISTFNIYFHFLLPSSIFSIHFACTLHVSFQLLSTTTYYFPVSYLLPMLRGQRMYNIPQPHPLLLACWNSFIRRRKFNYRETYTQRDLISRTGYSEIPASQQCNIVLHFGTVQIAFLWCPSVRSYRRTCARPRCLAGILCYIRSGNFRQSLCISACSRHYLKHTHRRLKVTYYTFRQMTRVCTHM